MHYNPGTLVRARRRLWRVDSQQDSTLYATAVDETTLQARIYLPFEAVEPGQLPAPDPNVVGTVQSLELMTRAFRLSMLHSTAPLLALQRSRAIPVSYQLVPVVMSLGQPQVRMLIADDIGLGKTIEAGLIMSELMARGQARRMLVVCPANLREQWQQALDYFFHIQAEILSRTNRRYLEKDLPAGSNLLEFYPIFIISVDYAKAPEIKNQLLEVPWDLALIDEAHQVAKPHQSSPDQRVKMDRWDLAKELAFSDKVRHLLLLTATPHNGYTDTFGSLLRLLNVGAVEGPEHAPTIRRGIAGQHIVQRRRQDVQEWLKDSRNGSGGLPSRDQGEEYITIGAEERQVIEAVGRYGEMILEHASGAKSQIRTLAGWAVLHLHKRALSSPEALRQSLKNRREALQRRLDKQVEEEAGLSSEAARANVLEEDTGEMFDEQEIGHRSEKVAPGSEQAIQAEFSALDELDALAARVTASRDSKLQHMLRNVLRNRLAQRHKLIIFSRYRDTMQYVADQIAKSPLFQHVKIEVIHGGMNDVQRQEALARFEKAKDAVLVATDAISEGINLQYLASQIVHYELPWNPNRLEQRNGRIDRFGQPEPEVYVRTLVMNETLDAAILKVMMEKARRIREDYGFSPPFFGDEINIIDFIQEHGLGVHLGSQQLSLFESQAQHELPDPYEEELIDRIRNESFYGQTDLSLDEIQEQMRRVEDSIGSTEEIQRFVISGLNRLNCSVTENNDGTLRILVRHPHLHLPGIGDEVAKATFDPQLGLDHRNVDVLDLGHPLVRAMLDLFKRESFQPDDSATSGHRYGRTAVQISPDVEEMTGLYTLLVCYATHTRPPQILEDLLTVAIPVYGDDALSLAEAQKLVKAQAAPGAIPDADAKGALEEALTRPDLNGLINAQIEARREEIVSSRQALRETLGKHSGWMQGNDELMVASWDLLSVKILWPS